MSPNPVAPEADSTQTRIVHVRGYSDEHAKRVAEEVACRVSRDVVAANAVMIATMVHDIVNKKVAQAIQEFETRRLSLPWWKRFFL